MRDAIVLKDTMVSVIALQVAHSQTSSSPELERLRGSAGDLVVLFEHMTAPESMKILVSLSSYYFGTGPGEVFDCLLLEKGHKVLPFLAAAAKNNECVQRFGAKAWEGKGPAACLNDSEFRDAMRSIAREIRQGMTCSLRDFY